MAKRNQNEVKRPACFTKQCLSKEVWDIMGPRGCRITQTYLDQELCHEYPAMQEVIQRVEKRVDCDGKRIRRNARGFVGIVVRRPYASRRQ